LAERARSSSAAKPAGRASAGREARKNGFWHRPKLLDVASDVLLLFAAVGLGWAAVTWALSRPLFPLRELMVSAPPAQVTQAQLEYVARTAIHGNFFTARPDDVRTAFETLPWVRRAEVRRLWPDGLELSLEEHKAAAYWREAGNADDVSLVDTRGEVFLASSDATMPELSGPPGSAATVLARYREYSRLLEPLQARLVKLDLSARGSWEMRLDNGLVIVLGREEERVPLEARLKQFVAAWPRLHDEFGLKVARADLRYPDGFALTPKDNKAAVPQHMAGNNRK